MIDYNQLHNRLAQLNDSSAQTITPVVCNLITPKSVVDVGCGDGTWLASFRKLGIDDLMGLDGDYIDRSSLRIPESCFQVCDLSGKLPVRRQFDLAVCLEVGEHLPTHCSKNLVQFLTQSAPVVFFSAAIPGQGGVNHINEQWQSFWVNLFKQSGFEVCDVLRPMFWENHHIAYYYAQNMFLFLRQGTLHEFPELKKIKSEQNMVVDMMHPTRAEKLLISSMQSETITIRQGAAAVYRGLYRKLLGRKHF